MSGAAVISGWKILQASAVAFRHRGELEESALPSKIGIALPEEPGDRCVHHRARLPVSCMRGSSDLSR
jgi:hypothetical protein